MQRLKSEYKHVLAKLNDVETSLKLKISVLENETKVLVKKNEKIKGTNSELVCN